MFLTSLQASEIQKDEEKHLQEFQKKDSERLDKSYDEN